MASVVAKIASRTSAIAETPSRPWPTNAGTWSLIPASALSRIDARRHPLLALQDTLTALGNRLAFQCIVEGLIDCERPFGLILLDLDGFKVVNDTLGHDAGDSLLQEVASIINKASEQGMAVTRLGGDEFAIVAPGITCRRALSRIASRYCEWIGRELNSYEPIPIRASAGAALFPSHANSRSEILKCADVALYESKRRGRNRATVFQSCMLQRVEKRAAMLRRASNCLAVHEGVAVVFQPKVWLKDGSISSYEALARFRDAKGCYRNPAWVKAAFDDVLLSRAIGNVVLDKSIAFLKELLKNYRPDARVAINATTSELCSKAWAHSLLSRLDKEGIPHSSIEIEVNESVLLGKSGAYACRTLTMLHEAGVRVALDDFGTGYASLQHLQSFPIDTLKIDQGFIKTLGDPESTAIVRAIVDLGRTLNMEVVAEGIEHIDQHKQLTALGCLLGQGFYYGRPYKSSRWLNKGGKGNG